MTDKEKAALARKRWRKTSKKERSEIASKNSRKRWRKIPKAERANHGPKTGGRRLVHGVCPKYKYHRFSPTTGVCPCGAIKQN
jgi:hypothetical protein